MAKNKKFFKKYLKAIQHSQGFPAQTKSLLQAAPIPVLKLLSNAAIIAAKGNIKINPHTKKLFGQKRKFFSVLGDKSVPFQTKRSYIVQRGGGAFIPLLLSTVIPLVGDLLFKAFTKQE